MKKSFIFGCFTAFLLICFISGCKANMDTSSVNVDNIYKSSQMDSKVNNVIKTIDKDDEIKEKARDIIYNTNIKKLKDNSKIGQSIPSVCVDIVGLKKRNDGYNVFANIIQMTYKFDKGIFDNESGAIFPIRYNMDLEFRIVKEYQVQDGGRFAPSIREMAENDEELLEKLMGSQGSFSSMYDYVMEDLQINAQIAGLKNFSHKKNEIPGYEEDVREIDDDTPNGVICIIKNKDYDKVQEERKEIVSPTVAGKHSVYAPCIYYNEKTGICVEDTVWYND